MSKRLAILFVFALPACGGNPAKPAPGTGTLWGYVRLVRREGVKLADRNDPVYADRRQPQVEMVDYKVPGFAVVYLEGPPSPGGALSVVLESRTGKARVGFHPEQGTVGTGGKIVLLNSDTAPHVVSCPRADLILTLKPGEEVEIGVTGEGPWDVFSPGETEAQARVFAAPGPHATVAENGYWELMSLPPGGGTLHAWHWRLPPAVRPVNVVAGMIERADLDVGVNNLSKEKSIER